TPVRAWPLSLSVAVVLGGCGGPDPQPAGGVSSPTGTKPRPTVVAVVRPRPGETLGARIRERTAVLAAPRRGARALFHVARHTPFDSPSVLAVIRQRGRWLGVASEHLSNGTVGWIRADRVKLLRELWRVDVDLSERRAVLVRKGRPYRSFAVAVGAPGTATPPGRYGVTDRLSTGGAASAYGCCVLALTGHQPNVPQDWPGGDRLAIHGTTAPSSIGQAASHGCLRASEASMRMLTAKVPLGAQVVIRR
ncbi:MAG: ErfK/YbiS/YcfS/YnhG family protein, partial [Solirubrobacterales bacterium]|nr:ErfK/YbiS/YcfS/YnhG family protein [Solirubrobacterales bacterium]